MSVPDLKSQFAALIATPSVSCTQPRWDQSNQAVIELLAAWLGDLGFRCEVQQVAPGKSNLLATYGTGPGGLVLAGHSDTVPFDAALWKTDPLKLSEAGNRWYGLGSCDMKGGAAVALHVTYHNFCWRPRLPGKTGRRRPTPAMAAGLVETLWDFETLFDAVTAHQEEQRQHERMQRLIERFRQS